LTRIKIIYYICSQIKKSTNHLSDAIKLDLFITVVMIF